MPGKRKNDPTIPRELEPELRQQRTVREAIKVALRRPLPVDDPDKYKSPPSARRDLNQRVEYLQQHRDELLVENARLSRIIDKLLDQIDVRRGSGGKGGRVRSKGIAKRNAEWQTSATQMRALNPRLGNAGIAKKIKEAMRCAEAVRTIREVLDKSKVGGQP